jgi:asparagine synthase (glutamine-hydrolysing)
MRILHVLDHSIPLHSGYTFRTLAILREPLLDHKMVEWASRLPASLKLQGGEDKYVFKKAMEPCLPNDILYRKKMGFSIPLASWFRGPLKEKVRQAVLGQTLEATGYFNTDYLRELVDQHQAGLRVYSTPLWTLLMFEAFLRRNGGARELRDN